MRYGGNTSCVSVCADGSQSILFDLGTGLRYFGKDCLSRDTKFVGTCLLTHAHFDHTQGLPFFAPLLNAETVLTIRGPIQDDGSSLKSVFDKLVSPPLFPVDLSHIPGTINFVDTVNSDFMIDDVRVKARIIPHVGTTLGYRIEFAGKSVAYLPIISSQSTARTALAMEPANLLKASISSSTIRNSPPKSSPRSQHGAIAPPNTRYGWQPHMALNASHCSITILRVATMRLISHLSV